MSSPTGLKVCPSGILTPGPSTAADNFQKAEETLTSSKGTSNVCCLLNLLLWTSLASPPPCLPFLMKCSSASSSRVGLPSSLVRPTLTLEVQETELERASLGLSCARLGGGPKHTLDPVQGVQAPMWDSIQSLLAVPGRRIVLQSLSVLLLQPLCGTGLLCESGIINQITYARHLAYSDCWVNVGDLYMLDSKAELHHPNICPTVSTRTVLTIQSYAQFSALPIRMHAD